MPDRSALLIGVSEYRNPSGNLDVVSGDLEELETVFRTADYAVDVPLRENEARTSGPDIIHAVETYARRVTAQTVVIYLSGHGLHYRKTDYLIPGDALVNRAEPTRFLISIDEIVAAFEETRNLKHLVVFFDACRSGVELNVKAPQYVETWGQDKIRELSNRQTAYIYGCQRGKESFHNGEFSYLSRALGNVFRKQSASTLNEVTNALHAELEDLDGGRQEIRCRTESGGTSDPLNDIILLPNGGSERTEPAEPDPWSRAVRSSKLWDAVDADRADAFREHALNIVQACRTSWDASRDGIPDDPWTDEQFPIRVIERLEYLVQRRCRDLDPNAAEVATLLVAPFVREAGFAASTRSVIDEARPFDAPNPESKTGICTSSSDGLRGTLEKTFQSMPQHVRRARRLWKDDQQEDYRTVAAWLVHHCVRRLPNLFKPVSEGGLFPDGVFDPCPSPDDREDVAESLSPDRLRTFARWVIADASKLHPETRGGPAARTTCADVTADEISVRDRAVAGLLALGGLLGLDGRRLSGVLIEHLGISRPIDPESILSTLESVRWRQDGNGLMLRGACPHPALDAALVDYVDAADPVAKDLDSIAHIESNPLNVLQGLPQRLTSDGLQSGTDESNTPIYQKPHLRFELDQTEVQELLMGKQLYGDPALAIRELYQNALDACRYRQARTQYLEATVDGFTSDWEGKIIFHQGFDDDGREYIECVDNGIGMGRRELQDAFAKAGRRYHDLPGFIEERAEWQQHGIEIYPNSQFGIGVFSYFMLADELEIQTSRMSRDREGVEGTLVIDVTGSGSLFHVRPAQEQAPQSGTRIRLYLRPNLQEDLDEPVSCVETLRTILWVAEFETVAVSLQDSEEWPRGVLKCQSLPLKRGWKRDSGSSNLPVHSLQTSEEHWLVKVESDTELNGNRYHATRDSLSNLLPEGRILADGIVTDVTVSGRIVNLSKAHRPELTIDRSKVVEYDHFFASHLLHSAKDAVVRNPSWVSMEWFWAFGAEYPFLADDLRIALQEETSRIPIRKDSLFISHTFRLDRVGCFPLDQLLWFEGDRVGYYLQRAPDSIWAARIRANLTDKLSRERGIQQSKNSTSAPPWVTQVLSKTYLDASKTTLVDSIDGVRLAFAMKDLTQIPYDWWFNDNIGVVPTLLQCSKNIGIKCFRLKNIKPQEIHKSRITHLDKKLLSKHLTGNYPLAREIDELHVLRAALRLEINLGIIEDRLRRLEEPLQIDLKAISFDKAKDASSDPAAIRLLSNLREQISIPRPPLSIGDFMQAVNLTGQPPEDTYNDLKRLLKIFKPEKGLPEYSKIEYIRSLTSDQLHHNIFCGLPVQDFSKSVTGVHLIGASRRERENVVDLGLRLENMLIQNGYEAFNFDVTRLRDIRIPERYFDFLSKYMEGGSPYLRGLSVDRLVIMSWFLEENVNYILEGLRPLEEVGFQLPEVDENGFV